MNKKFIDVKNEGLWSAFSEQYKGPTPQQILEGELAKLLDFLKEWKSKYDLFCHEFNCYSHRMTYEHYLGNSNPYWIDSKNPIIEKYMDRFFDRIITMTAELEIQINIDYEYRTIKTVEVIKTNDFTLSKENNDYKFSMEMHPALVISLIASMSESYIVFDLMKNKRFYQFIANLCENNVVDFSIDSYKRILFRNQLVIDFNKQYKGSPCFVYFSNMKDETFAIEYFNWDSSPNFGYTHLDRIFGSNRKKPLDEEDLQLYSILNEGKKPTMYDFEY